MNRFEAKGCLKAMRRLLICNVTLHAMLSMAVLQSTIGGRAEATESAPVVKWSFGTEAATPISLHGSVLRDQPGPRPPEYPAFDASNTSVYLDGRGSYLSVEDTGPRSKFDFQRDDEITIEAWVRVDDENRPVAPAYMYIVGKGRTGSESESSENQNWAMRLQVDNRGARLSFLFSTEDGYGRVRWHRWTSKNRITDTNRWHHVAVSYQFGAAESIRGWIDASATPGTWEMSGATDKVPRVDNSDVWIGSSRGGNQANSFCGWIDEVALHRVQLDDAYMASQYPRDQTRNDTESTLVEKMPDLGVLPAGRVAVILSERMPDHTRWPRGNESWPNEVRRFPMSTFLLPRLPLKHDDGGIRDAWRAPLLVTMAADVELPPGDLDVLLHARGLARLWIDGILVTRSDRTPKPTRDGEEPVTPYPAPVSDGVRAPRYGQFLSTGSLETTSRRTPASGLSRVVLEVIVGGKGQRTETGEVTVAVKSRQQDTYQLLTPAGGSNFSIGDYPERDVPFTDKAIEPLIEQVETELARMDLQDRRALASSMDEYWDMRHEVATNWAVEASKKWADELARAGTDNLVDFLSRRHINQAIEAASEDDHTRSERFHTTIVPLLQQHCYRCHGEKANGGLRLDSLDHALAGGDSGIPAVVPGSPQESELIARVRSEDESMRMPPTGEPLSDEQVALLSDWIVRGCNWPAPPVDTTTAATRPVVDDASFLRRVYLDLIGVPPTSEEVRRFLTNGNKDKRSALVDQLLDDPRYAGHWTSYWQDLLGENPTLLNHSLDSTGPFRWFIYDALRDNKSLDRMVTELIMMRGDPYYGGSSGFELAFENDAPYAAKASIVAGTFLGIETKCARCHDSPYHASTQRDLFSVAAMLERRSVVVPESSRVPAAFFEKKGRKPLIEATLKPDESVEPNWSFEEQTGLRDDLIIEEMLLSPADSRERLAALVTAPQNKRFAPVAVNLLWKRLFGAGFVEPVNDWEGQIVSHPELLDWLATELVASGYDVKHVLRLIATSQLYQRQAVDAAELSVGSSRYFFAPVQRRLSAEQVVDSLHASLGMEMDVEPLTFIHDGRRPMSVRLTLGTPTRAWMLASLNNERDRPSLALPKAQTVVDVLQAFGWTGSRQTPVYGRSTDSNVLQPGVLCNGALSNNLTRAAYGSSLADLATKAVSPEELVKELYLRILNRFPTEFECREHAELLSEGFDSRHVSAEQQVAPRPAENLPLVTWQNHLQPEANLIQQQNELRVRKGPPGDPRLTCEWRTLYEDVVWSLINHPEFVWIP